MGNEHMNGGLPPPDVAPDDDDLEFVPPPLPSEELTAAESGEGEESEGEDTRTARQRVLDWFEDTEGPQSVAQVVEGTALNRPLVEVTLSRAVKGGLLERVEQGVYRLAPKPAEPPEPAESSSSPPRIRNGRSDQEWLEALHELRVAPESWDRGKFGPRPTEIGCRVPLDVVATFRRQVEEVTEAGAATEAELAADADRRLLTQLLRASAANIMPDAMDDIGPIKAMLEKGVPREIVLKSLLQFDFRGTRRPPAPLQSWRDPRFLRAVAEAYAMTFVPGAVAAWSDAPAVIVPPPPRGSRKSSGSVLGALAHESAPAGSAGAQGALSLNAEPGSAAYMLAKLYTGDADDKQIASPAVENELSDQTLEEFVLAYMEGVLAWNEERLGPPPGHVGCRIPARILRAYKL